MENTQIKLSETVMVIDVAYLNFVINDLRKYPEFKLTMQQCRIHC